MHFRLGRWKRQASEESINNAITRDTIKSEMIFLAAIVGKVAKWTLGRVAEKKIANT